MAGVFFRVVESRPKFAGLVSTQIEFWGKLRAQLCGLVRPPENAGYPSAPVRTWGVQSASNRQDLEQALLVCLLRLRF